MEHWKTAKIRLDCLNNVHSSTFLISIYHVRSIPRASEFRVVIQTYSSTPFSDPELLEVSVSRGGEKIERCPAKALACLRQVVSPTYIL